MQANPSHKWAQSVSHTLKSHTDQRFLSKHKLEKIDEPGSLLEKDVLKLQPRVEDVWKLSLEPPQWAVQI